MFDARDFIVSVVRVPMSVILQRVCPCIGLIITADRFGIIRLF